MLIWTSITVLLALTAAVNSESPRELSTPVPNYVYSGTDWGGYCADEDLQSPLDFRTVQVAFLDEANYLPVVIGYESFYPSYGFTPDDYRVVGDFGRLELQTVMGGGVEVFEGDRVVFKAPSEHTVEGHHFPLEMQLHHRFISLRDSLNDRATNSSSAVLSVLFELGTEHPLISSILSNDASLDLSSLSPDGFQFSDFYLYDGAETTFPCEENVRWAVLAKPRQLSSDQLTFFQSKWADNLAFARGNGNNKATVNSYEGRPVFRVLW